MTTSRSPRSCTGSSPARARPPTSRRWSARTRCPPATATTCASRAAFESEFLSQPLEESRSLEETLDRAWAVASLLPRGELSMISPRTRDAALPTPTRWRCESRPVGPAGPGSLGRLEIAQPRRRAARPQAPGAAARAGAHPRAKPSRRAQRGTRPRPGRAVERPRGIVDGAGRLELLARHVEDHASLELSWSNFMGARFPARRHRRPGAAPALGARRQLSRRAAGARPREAARAAARHAVAERADAELSAELGRAARRLRALQERWIPEHEQALAPLDLALDESQREQAVTGPVACRRRPGD